MLQVHPIANTGFSRTYIIEDLNGLLVVDVGSIGAARDVAKYVKHLGRSIEEIAYITATHFHIDHIGGIEHLIKQCGATTRVLFNWRVRDYLTGKKKISLIRNWRSGLIPATAVSARYVRRLSHFFFMNLSGIPLPWMRGMVNIPVDRERIGFFGDGTAERYALGFGGWEVIETPGHTEDSVSFYNEMTRELICGDLIVNISKSGRGILNRFHWRGDLLKESFAYLCANMSPIVLYPGHGEVIRDKNNALDGVEIS